MVVLAPTQTPIIGHIPVSVLALPQIVACLCYISQGRVSCTYSGGHNNSTEEVFYRVQVLYIRC